MNNAQLKALNSRENELNQLFQQLGSETIAINSLEGKICENEPKAVNKPSLFARISAWIGNLVALKNKESDIISRICAIENKHLELKKHNQLRHIGKENDLLKKPVLAKKKSKLWFWIIFLMLMMKKKNKPVKLLQLG